MAIDPGVSPGRLPGQVVIATGVSCRGGCRGLMMIATGVPAAIAAAAGGWE